MLGNTHFLSHSMALASYLVTKLASYLVIKQFTWQKTRCVYDQGGKSISCLTHFSTRFYEVKIVLMIACNKLCMSVTK
jgi:hypothetical protein